MCLFILGWALRGRATASATAPSWSLAGLFHVAVGGVFAIGSPKQWSLQLGGVVFVTSSTTSGVAIVFGIGLPWP
jgi:hypothetical protein